MLQIEALEIDDHVLDKIETEHGVSFHQVEEACFYPKRYIRRSREGLYKVFSRAESGRYLLVVLVNLGGGTWKIVTARDMLDNEKRLYKKETGGS